MPIVLPSSSTYVQCDDCGLRGPTFHFSANAVGAWREAGGRVEDDGTAYCEDCRGGRECPECNALTVPSADGEERACLWCSWRGDR